MADNKPKVKPMTEEEKGTETILSIVPADGWFALFIADEEDGKTDLYVYQGKACFKERIAVFALVRVKGAQYVRNFRYTAPMISTEFGLDNAAEMGGMYGIVHENDLRKYEPGDLL